MESIEDPFIFESRIITFQLYIKNRHLIRKNKQIIKNIGKLVNFRDPINLEHIVKLNKFHYNVDIIYPLFRNNKMYLYTILSLYQIIKYNRKEIYTNTVLTINEKKNILRLFKKLNIAEITLEDNIFFKKIDVLKLFEIIGIYFPIDDYNNIEKNKFRSIYCELKNIWKKFLKDNNLTEEKLLNKKLNWKFIIKDETELLDRIVVLLDNNLDSSMKIMISYIIIGAFAYVCPHIKKYYENIVFE